MMEWRRIADLSSYEVSEYGHVRRTVRGGRRYPAGYILTPKPHQRGYRYYDLVRDDGTTLTILEHRLVALAFLPPIPSPGCEIAHGDGTRTNNHFKNLRWATSKENQDDRKRHGTFHHGDNCASSKITSETVASIRDEYKSHGQRYKGGAVTYKTLAEKYGLSQSQISRIVNGKQWTHSTPTASSSSQP